VEEDGAIDIGEDFSNNIEYFLFEPTKLKAKTPKVYQWIKEKYGDSFKPRKGKQ
jgi:Mlc titration factor MtfA (ptsG expression regulator)